jgi:hypothetical protein
MVLWTDPEAEAQPTAPPCEIWLGHGTFVENYRVKVYVDCEVVSYCDEAQQCWEFDEPQEPLFALFNDALCSRLEQDGYTRIDIVDDCGRHPF